MKNIIEGAINNLFNKIGILPKEKKDLASNRLEICKSCPIMYYDNSTKSLRCGNCNCFINWKVSCTECKCPEGKW